MNFLGIPFSALLCLYKRLDGATLVKLLQMVHIIIPVDVVRLSKYHLFLLLALGAGFLQV